ncbi:GIY-YIG nuclease family protein [Pelagicoccus sp. SDUM812002]|uniref:GIY-YIG nuclease family protein n=1 Tax=Pelagicoccus sp. SDUM812002 TaxID=3041266 RepID=UPI00280E0652|nr:GIY-YIG nuclease family protein [Pelagicoccus sp. SDUM812002]MDQ8187679.1 GIY-YIG nuclease family protein [Pelagicoccus sp. SDUM812002]
MTGKTLQTYLPEGTPSGIRIAELTTRIVLAVSVPRTKLEQFFHRLESQHIGTYFLFGGSDDDTKPISYIGQTEDLKTRLKNHDANKEFWTTAVVLISRTHSFTQAHIRWLEWHSILKAKEANRYHLENGNSSGLPFVTEPILADLHEIFETGSLLLESLGYPIFKPLVSKPETNLSESENEKWYLKSKDVDAIGVFTTEGFILLKNSKLRAEFTPGAVDSGFARKRHKLVEEAILKLDGNSYIAQEDFICNSPSQAAAISLARHSNGWVLWKNKFGQTLDEVKRQSEN